MALVRRVHNKLLTEGFLPDTQTEDHERWIDTRGKSRAISFYKNNNKIDVFKVHGLTPDMPEFDEFSSYYTHNLSEAIRISKV